MLSDDLMTNIQRLPLDEKLALLEALMQAVHAELHQESIDTAHPDTKRLIEVLGIDGPLPPFAELGGILAMNTPSAEEDWKDDYADYLTKKYA